jgi:heme exporter protein D
MKEIYIPETLGNYSKLIWMAVFISVSALLAGVIAKYYSQPMNQWLRKSFNNMRTKKSLTFY